MTNWDPVYRQFACLCAREAADASGIPVHGFVELAERFIVNDASASDLEAAQSRARVAILSTGEFGVPRCMPAAAALLSAFSTCHSDARKAANDAADMALRVTLFNEARRRSATWTLPKGIHESWRAAAWLERYYPDLEPVKSALHARRVQQLECLVADASNRRRGCKSRRRRRVM
jgi:hypothetical protein